MLTKILITRPIFSLGTLSNKKEFLNILAPELDSPSMIEIKNNDAKYLLLIITNIERLVKIMSKKVNLILSMYLIHL